MAYDYYAETASAVRAYIADNNITPKDFGSKDEMYEHLYDECWVADSVTGNGSGSFTFNSSEAEENLVGNRDLLADAMREFEGDWERAATDSEYADVTIRCYILGEVIGTVLEEDYDDEDFEDDEDDEEEDEE